MKKTIFSIIIIALSALQSCSCSRVAPNYYGVLMENYGKEGKSDYKKQQGNVSTSAPGTELFQVPAWEQRADFNDKEGNKKTLHLKAADNTEFTANPVYSYMAIESKVVDLVFQNARLGSGSDFMRSLEDNVIEPNIYDIIKEESRKYITDTLMATGGSLKFEERVQILVKKELENKGLQLLTFSANLDFSEKVKAKIDSRNEVNTNVSVIDQQIIEQKKRNELAELKAKESLIISAGLTPQILKQQQIDVMEDFVKKWDGKTPLYGDISTMILKQ